MENECEKQVLLNSLNKIKELEKQNEKFLEYSQKCYDEMLEILPNVSTNWGKYRSDFRDKGLAFNMMSKLESLIEGYKDSVREKEEEMEERKFLISEKEEELLKREATLLEAYQKFEELRARASSNLIKNLNDKLNLND